MCTALRVVSLSPPPSLLAGAGGPQSGVEQVAVEVLLPGGRRHSHDAQLADFGPAFMPGCGKLVGSSADDGSVSAEGGGGSSSSSSGTAGGGAQQQPKPPGEPPTYMGRRLELRAGGPPERPWKVVHLGPPFLVRGGTGDGGAKAQQQQQQQRQAAAAAAAAAAEDDEDDPYADDPEEEAPGQQQQQQRMAADDDEEVYADGLEDEEAGEGPVVLCALEAPAAAAQPLEACGPLQNAAALKGAVAVVKRGGCVGARGASGGMPRCSPGSRDCLSDLASSPACPACAQSCCPARPLAPLLPPLLPAAACL